MGEYAYRLANDPQGPDKNRADWWRTIADRIRTGYETRVTDPAL